jgi:uncharacterized membrane protein YcaP (DUF421 family)
MDIKVLQEIFTADQHTISYWQMAIRGVFTFFLTIILLSVAGRRAFGKYASFDIVFGIIIGSVISRGITGNANYFGAMLTSFSMALVYRLLSYARVKSNFVNKILKGEPIPLVKDGKIFEEGLFRGDITKEDIFEAMRENGLDDLVDIREAYLESNGKISIIKK